MMVIDFDCVRVHLDTVAVHLSTAIDTFYAALNIDDQDRSRTSVMSAGKRCWNKRRQRLRKL